MGGNSRPSRGVVSKLSTAALAVAALLTGTQAPAQGPVAQMVETAKATADLPASEKKKTAPQLVLQPSNKMVNQLGHGSHASHSSHVSGSGGGGGSGIDPTPAPAPAPRSPAPAPTPAPYNPPASQEPPKPARQPASRPSTQPAVQYPFLVHLKDGRAVECDIETDGDYMILKKRAGTLRVLKTDIKQIEPRTVASSQPSAPPTTQRSS
jgi:outer membrane biosynthesis protein TonB